MAEYDVIDEAIIDADTATTYNALLDELRGLTKWWKPYCEGKPKGDIPVGQVGAIFDITVRHTGTIRATAKITEIVENQLIRYDYIEGDWVGKGEWTFEPTNGKTRIRFRWRTRANSLLMKLTSPFLDIGKFHSEVMQAGYEGLKKHLESVKSPV
jgi:uncharacterized protein YndB with AHSA1/START domain